jgi:hypothetical protein
MRAKRGIAARIIAIAAVAAVLGLGSIAAAKTGYVSRLGRSVSSLFSSASQAPSSLGAGQGEGLRAGRPEALAGGAGFGGHAGEGNSSAAGLTNVAWYGAILASIAALTWLAGLLARRLRFRKAAAA